MGERLILRWGSKGTPHQRVRKPPSERTPLTPLYPHLQRRPGPPSGHIPPLSLSPSECTTLTCSGGLAPRQGISRSLVPLPPSERTTPPPSPAAAAWLPLRASLEFSAPPATTLLLLLTFPNTNDLLAALADAARCSEAVAVRPMKEAP